MSVGRLTAGRCCTGEAISRVGVCPLEDQPSCLLFVGVVGCANRGPLAMPPVFIGDAVGVVCRKGEGDTGDSARRKGELRVAGGEP
jgi:hypothetical protein